MFVSVCVNRRTEEVCVRSLIGPLRRRFGHMSRPLLRAHYSNTTANQRAAAVPPWRLIGWWIGCRSAATQGIVGQIIKEEDTLNILDTWQFVLTSSGDISQEERKHWPAGGATGESGITKHRRVQINPSIRCWGVSVVTDGRTNHTANMAKK